MKRAVVVVAVIFSLETALAGPAWGNTNTTKDSSVTTNQPARGQEGRFGVGKDHFRPGTGAKKKSTSSKPKTPNKIVTERNYRGPETAHCADGVGWRRWVVRRSDNQRIRVLNTGCGSGPEVAGAKKEETIPVPVVGISPRAEGLTGLITGLWHEGPTERSASINVAGETMTVTYRPTRFTWTMGDGSAPITRTPPEAPGSEADWAAEHTYEKKGDFTIELEVVWEGSYTRTPPGGAPETVSVPSITVTGSLDYHVIEVRSGLEA